MRNPSVYKVTEIYRCNNLAQVQHKEGWIPARPWPWHGIRLFKNLKIAWFVLIGRYDALDWED